MKEVIIDNIKIGNNRPLALISGPCVIEDEKTTLAIAERLKRISSDNRIPFIFKASYEKDNRSTASAYRGPGLEKGLSILKKIKKEFNVPVLSDVHRETDVDQAAEVLDVIQIPAFLCQQTSLLLKAGSAMKPVNVKKGQFLSPENMEYPAGKIRSTGNDCILLTERGSCFGYNRLVADVCGIPIMQGLGFPVIFDATHIIRIYGVPSADARGGSAQFISHLARAGVAAGCDGIFLETHTDLSRALCDAASMLAIDLLPGLLDQIIPISEIIRKTGGGPS